MPTKKPAAAPEPAPPIDHSTLPHAQRLERAAVAYHLGLPHPDEEYTQRVAELDMEQRLAAFFNGWGDYQNALATKPHLVADARIYVLAQLARERLAKEQ